MITTFQAIVFGIVHGFTIFLPVSWAAHDWLLHFVLGWQTPTGAFHGALSLGAFLSLLVYFRHDWASILSSTLRIILLFKKPMTLDERLPFFVLLSCLPLAVGWYVFREDLSRLEINAFWVSGTLLGFCIPLLLAERMNRKLKSMLDWNWFDAFIVGICQLLILIPGGGRQVGALTGALLRNFHPEAAAKFSFLSFAPILCAFSVYHLIDVDFRASEAMAGYSWLSFGVTVVVTFLAGLVSLGGFMKNIQYKRFGAYAIYRVIIGLGILAVYWVGQRS